VHNHIFSQLLTLDELLDPAKGRDMGEFPTFEGGDKAIADEVCHEVTIVSDEVNGKSACLMMPVAIQQMGTSIGGLNMMFECAANALEANTSNTLVRSVDPIPLCRQKAVRKLQSEGLEDVQLLNILNKFQADIAIVDIYLAIEVDSLQQLFLEQHSK
jgi:hypothetical protein